MRLTYLFTIGIFLLTANDVSAQHVHRDFVIADSLATRLQPTKHPGLPKHIAVLLDQAGYSIPQSWMDSTAHNVIKGEFKMPGQSDVAVLASRNRISSIIIFWAGSISDTTHLNMGADLDYMQDEADRGIVFSRVIQQCPKSAVARSFKKAQEDEPGYDQPDQIDHEAIEDHFISKASTIHYFCRGRWLSCLEAD